jgi:hypothetical protein
MARRQSSPLPVVNKPVPIWDPDYPPIDEPVPVRMEYIAPGRVADVFAGGGTLIVSQASKTGGNKMKLWQYALIAAVVLYIMKK